MRTSNSRALAPTMPRGARRWDQPALNLDAAAWARHRAQLERHEPFHDFEMERPGGGGGRVWLSLSGEPIFDAAGRFTGYRGVGRDITVRKSEERLKSLEHAVTRGLAEAENASPALQGVLRAICASENWDCGCYFGVDADAGVLRLVETWTAPDSGLEQLVPSWRAAATSPPARPLPALRAPGAAPVALEAAPA